MFVFALVCWLNHFFLLGRLRRFCFGNFFALRSSGSGLSGSGWFRRLGSCGCRITIARNGAHYRIHLNGITFRHLDFLEDTRGWGGDFCVDLIGGDLKQGFVALHFVPRFLEPFGDGALENRFTHLGHDDVRRHNSLPSSPLMRIRAGCKPYIIYTRSSSSTRS